METADDLGTHRVDSDCEASVTTVAGGDIAGLSQLYGCLRKPVFLLAYSILGDYALAEDIMQETFLRVNEKAATYRAGSNPKAWVLSIARSVALNARKSRIRENLCEDTTNGMVTGTATDLFANTVENKAVLNADFTRALTCLDEQERGIIILKIGGNLKHSEIAEILGITTGDARVRYFRALKKLKRYYGE